MLRNLILAGALAAGLSACATATPYQPNVRGAAVTGGFSEVQIEDDRWRVEFAGNSLTSRERVETYLLYRAAGSTLAQGYDWFQTVDRETDVDRRVIVDDFSGRYGYGGFGGGYGFGRGYGFGYGGGFWRPSWRYYGRGYGWRGWDPYFGGPFWGDRIDVRQVDRYEANAEVVMGRGTPADDPNVFSAREVVENLRTQIVYPEERRRG